MGCVYVASFLVRGGVLGGVAAIWWLLQAGGVDTCVSNDSFLPW
jgi:hypothetical protein